MLKSFGCTKCGKQAPKKLRREDAPTFAKRMSWLRNHNKRYHYTSFRRSIKKGVQTRMANRELKIVGTRKAKPRRK